jgi:hypothetical protein
MNKIQNLINSEINNIYNSKLLPALQTFAIYTPGDAAYTEYDLSENYKKEINATITEKKK